MKKTEIEDFISLELEVKSFETILEEYDLTPVEVFWLLYQQGLIDDEILEGNFDAY